MSGTQWIYLQGIDCFELLAIGIPVQGDNGRQNSALCLCGSATKRVKRLCGEPVGEGKSKKKQRHEKRKMQDDAKRSGHTVIPACEF